MYMNIIGIGLSGSNTISSEIQVKLFEISVLHYFNTIKTFELISSTVFAFFYLVGLPEL